MLRSDIDDPAKFFPPSGRFYLVHFVDAFVGVGCLKRLAPGVGEVQRMYVRPHVRGVGAGRLLVTRLLADAKALGYTTVRLESLRALTAAYQLYRSVGFVEIEAYAANSMDAYQDPSALATYRRAPCSWKSDSEATRRDAQGALRRTLSRQDTLGHHFVGLYLDGSLVIGDFASEKSNIDFIVVTDAEVPPILRRPSPSSSTPLRQESGCESMGWNTP
jgi:ribosomal protein S18 acetylase RimI-like enzyme